MASKVREKIRLVSTGKDVNGCTTKTFYTTVKNRRNQSEKMHIKKYDPKAFNVETGKVGMHVVFKEEKMK